MTPIAVMAMIIMRADAERPVDGADTRADGAADDGTDRSRRAVARMCALLRTAYQSLRLRDQREGQTRAKTSGKNKTKFHYILLDGHVTATPRIKFGSALSAVSLCLRAG